MSGSEARPAPVRTVDLVGHRCTVPRGTPLRPAPGGRAGITRPLAAEAEGTITSYGHIGGGPPVAEVGITGIPGAERQVLYANLADVRVLAGRAASRCR